MPNADSAGAAEALLAQSAAAHGAVADGYSLFLLGPMLLAGAWSQSRTVRVALAAPQRFAGYECDVLRVHLQPGLGLADADELALWIDQTERLMRRVRFTLNGLDATKGAIADVGTSAHLTLHDLRWPTRFHEGLVRPLPLPVHDWRLTGLDVDRGLSVTDVSGPMYTGAANHSAGTV